MELTISLLFFAFAAAVCIQMFVRSHKLNEESDRLGAAHVIAVDIAETYRAGQLELLLPGVKDEAGHYIDGSYTLYYAGDGVQVTNEASDGYRVDLLLAEGNLDIDVADIYKLSVYRYFPEERVELKSPEEQDT